MLTSTSAVLHKTDVHNTAKQSVQAQSMAGRVLLRCVHLHIHFRVVLPLPQPESVMQCNSACSQRQSFNQV